MKTLTTLDGHEINFTPGSVTAITDHDLAEVGGAQVTCIYGITAGVIKIAQSVRDFIASLGIADKFFPVTVPSGLTIQINASAVKSVIQPEAGGGYSDKVQSVISVGSMTLGVTEDMASVAKAIDAHAGKV